MGCFEKLEAINKFFYNIVYVHIVWDRETEDYR